MNQDPTTQQVPLQDQAQQAPPAPEMPPMHVIDEQAQNYPNRGRGMRKLVVGLALASVALAGCSVENPGDGPNGHGADSTSTSANQGDTGPTSTIAPDYEPRDVPIPSPEESSAAATKANETRAQAIEESQALFASNTEAVVRKLAEKHTPKIEGENVSLSNSDTAGKGSVLDVRILDGVARVTAATSKNGEVTSVTQTYKVTQKPDVTELSTAEGIIKFLKDPTSAKPDTVTLVDGNDGELFESVAFSADPTDSSLEETPKFNTSDSTLLPEEQGSTPDDAKKRHAIIDKILKTLRTLAGKAT